MFEFRTKLLQTEKVIFETASRLFLIFYKGTQIQLSKVT